MSPTIKRMAKARNVAQNIVGGIVGLIALSVVAGILVAASLTPALAVSGAAVTRGIGIFDSLPGYLEVDRPMEPSTMYYIDSAGNEVEMASWYDQNRIPLEFNEISPFVYDGLVSSEDKNYFEHGGVDIVGLTRAVVTQHGGASTISQQYVKNVLMQQCEQEVPYAQGDEGIQQMDTLMADCWRDAVESEGIEGYKRKLQELRFAMQIEKDYSKNDIIKGYLNLVNFGGTVRGIGAASEYYFSTAAKDLSLAQAATLVGMVQNPNGYRIDQGEEATYLEDASKGIWVNSSADGWVKTKERRDYVLGRMLEDKKITQAQYDEAIATPIEPHITEPESGCVIAGDNAYFCQYVKNIIERNPIFGETPADRQGLLRRGGLKIYTTLNPEIQEVAVRTIRETVPVSNDEFYPGAAAINMDNRNGNLYALAQNTTFRETDGWSKAAGEFGIIFAASDEYGDSIGFNVGSTYKVFSLLAWLEQGQSLRKGLNGNQRLFNDIQCDGMNLPAKSEFDDPDFNGITNYEGNPGYGGTVLDFTRDSLNTGYLAMAEKLGNACDVHRVAERLGANWGVDIPLLDKEPRPEFHSYVQGRDMSGYELMQAQSALLGSANIALLDLAPAYAAIANNGVLCEPRAIERIVDPSGNELAIPPVDCQEKIKPDVAAAAAYALQGVMQGSGTGSQANPWDGIPVLGKTGSHESSQTMMMSATTNTTTGVWVGNIEARQEFAGYWTHDSIGNADLDKYWGPDGTRLNNARYYIDRSIQETANRIFGGNDFPEVDNRFLIYDGSELPPPPKPVTPTQPNPAPSQPANPQPSQPAEPAPPAEPVEPPPADGGDGGGAVEPQPEPGT